MPWQRSDRRQSRSVVRRAYEAYRCPPAAYSRAKGRAWGRAARIFAPGMVAAVIGVTAFLLIAVRHDTQLQKAAEALQAADSVHGEPMAPVSAYVDRLVEVQAVTGGTLGEIVFETLDAAQRLRGEDGNIRASTLSILNAVVWVAEASQDDEASLPIREYFSRAIGRTRGAPMPQGNVLDGPAENYMQPQSPGMWEYLPGQGRESQGEPYGYD